MLIIYKNCEQCGCLTIHSIETGECLECVPFDELGDEERLTVLQEMSRLASFATVALKYARNN